MRSLGRAITAGAACLAAALTIASCGRSGDSTSETRPPSEIQDVVRTTFYPTTYFAQRISGGLVPVECPLPEGEDPIFWRPDVTAISAYQRARLTVLNGCEFEKWAISAPLARSRTVASIEADLIDGGAIIIEGVTHSHGPAGEHSHDGIDGHTWVDPVLAKKQARRIAEAMGAAFPQHGSVFTANTEALLVDLDRLEARLRELTPAVTGAKLLASHPAYNYLARRMGWTITSFDFDPEAELAAESMTELAAELRSLGVAGPVVLLWESEPLPETVRSLERELGVASVLFTPVESEPAEGEDYLSVMNANVDRLAAALAPGDDG